MIAFIRTMVAAAALMSVYNVCADLINGAGNPYLALATLAGALWLLADDIAKEYVHNCRVASGRAGVWSRRDREAGR